MYQINDFAFCLYAGGSTDLLNVCMLVAIAYYVPYQLRCGNIFILVGEKMMKAVKFLSR